MCVKVSCTHNFGILIRRVMINQAILFSGKPIHIYIYGSTVAFMLIKTLIVDSVSNVGKWKSNTTHHQLVHTHISIIVPIFCWLHHHFRWSQIGASQLCLLVCSPNKLFYFQNRALCNPTINPTIRVFHPTHKMNQNGLWSIVRYSN